MLIRTFPLWMAAVPFLALRDGEGAGDESPAGGDNPGGAGGAGSGAGSKVEFTPEQQEKVNALVAKERKNLEAKLNEQKTAYEELLATHNLTAETRSQLEGKLADLNKQLATTTTDAKTREQQIKAQFETEVSGLKKSVEDWKNRFLTSTVDRALLDAATGGDAFQPSQIVGLLRGMTRVEEVKDEKTGAVRYEPVIDFPDVDPESKQPVVTKRNPAEAVSRMKELPDIWGNLFKSGVVSGLGANSATGGGLPGQGGRIDPTKISQEEYRRLRRENPAALGLPTRR